MTLLGGVVPTDLDRKIAAQPTIDRSSSGPTSTHCRRVAVALADYERAIALGPGIQDPCPGTTCRGAVAASSAITTATRGSAGK